MALVLTAFLLYGLGAYFFGKSANFNSIFGTKSNQSRSQTEIPIESPVPFADSQQGSVVSSYVKLCSNTLYGFEVAYPKDWFSTYQIKEQQCRFFAPYSFVVPSLTDFQFVPIQIEVVDSQDWLSVVKFHENANDYQNVLSIQNIEINGRSVKKILAETTAQSNLPRSFAKLSFLIYDGKKPLVFSYTQLDEKEDVHANKKILEEMVSSLGIF